MAPIRYGTVLFDWGDTVMKDDPSLSVPMVEWPQVYAVEGIAAVLSYLQSSGRRCMLATSANISDEAQIRAALERLDLDRFFERIFCFKNTGLQKGTDFYIHILSALDLSASETAMVGDHFEKDVAAANAAGLFAIWFNPRSGHGQEGPLHRTVHSMSELLQFFMRLDASGNITG